VCVSYPIKTVFAATVKLLVESVTRSLRRGGRKWVLTKKMFFAKVNADGKKAAMNNPPGQVRTCRA
jgi:hypothetical protein